MDRDIANLGEVLAVGRHGGAAQERKKKNSTTGETEETEECCRVWCDKLETARHIAWKLRRNRGASGGQKELSDRLPRHHPAFPPRRLMHLLQLYLPIGTQLPNDGWARGNVAVKKSGVAVGMQTCSVVAKIIDPEAPDQRHFPEGPGYLRFWFFV